MLKHAIKYFLLPKIAKRNGFEKIIKYYQSYLLSQYLPAWEIKNKQFKKLKKILVHVYENTIFYKDRYEPAGFQPEEFRQIEDIKKIPVLTKKDISSFLSDMIADNFCTQSQYAEDRCYGQPFYSVSGGTTGKLIELYNDQMAM